MTRLGFVAWTAVGCLLLAGCASPKSSPTPSPSVTSWPAAACQDAGAGVGRAVQRVIDEYNTPPTASASPTPSPSNSGPTAPSPAGPTPAIPTPSGQGDAGVQAALDAARSAVTEHGCTASLVQDAVQRGLAAVQTRGPIAEAVLKRMRASIDGKIGSAPADVAVAAGADLAAALAEAPAGSTLRLAAGEYRLASTLVLLDGVTIRGAGRDATVLRSTAPETSILVLADERVDLVNLTVIRSADAAGSGIVAGGTASLVLTGVRISGARGSAGQGGAGVLMIDDDAKAPGRGTTLEVTDSTFDDNGWAGLALRGGHRVSILTSTFTGNGECGTCFLDASDGSVRNSTFTNNLVGIGIGGTARPTVLTSTITGGGIGVQIEGQAVPILDGNRIDGANRAAVIVIGSATGTIARTTCSNVPYGIVVGDTAAPTLVDNTCTLARGAV